MVINKKLINYLKSEEIDENTAILYLLGIYFNLDTSRLPSLTKKKVNVLNIVERSTDYNEIVWKIPLFEGQETTWQWVEDYRDLFRSVRPNVGNLSSCVDKMKRFFAEHPEIRKEDVMKAANYYITPFRTGREDVKMMQRADYFIFKGKGVERTSRLEEYLEIVQEEKQTRNFNIR